MSTWPTDTIGCITSYCFPGFWRWTDTLLYTVLGAQEAQINTVLYMVWGSEQVKGSVYKQHVFF